MANLLPLQADRCLIVAEIGCNHLGRRDVALQMLHAAREAGADAAKFQVFRTAELYAAEDPEHAKLAREELSFDDFRALREECRRLQLAFVATPFDHACADFLGEQDVDAFKIGSGELNYLSLLRHVAGKGRPVVLSTGMSDDAMIAQAVATIRDAGGADIRLLHCVSAYPAPLADANVRAMVGLRQRFGLPVGLSDHCREPYAAYAAVTFGACLVEKHITLSSRLPGDDHAMAIDPVELADLVAGIRAVEKALGRERNGMFPSEPPTQALARRALYARCDVARGEVFSEDNVVVRRPPHAEAGAETLDDFLGRRAACGIAAGTPLRRELMDGEAGKRQ